MKSEPDVFSIDDLAREKKAHWDGVRNYQARNFMRDQMKRNDLVLFYHSSTDPSGVAGLARVCGPAIPDPPSTKTNPIWMMVEIEFVAKFPRFVSLEELKKTRALKGIMVVRRGIRLSIQPVSQKHFQLICKMGGL